MLVICWVYVLVRHLLVLGRCNDVGRKLHVFREGVEVQFVTTMFMKCSPFFSLLFDFDDCITLSAFGFTLSSVCKASHLSINHSRLHLAPFSYWRF